MLHPAVRLLVWAAAVLALQVLQAYALWMAGGACIAAALACSGARTLKLLRRIRWIVLALVVVFAWGTPGVYLFPQFGSASPTPEGLLAALDHGLRLAAIVALLSVLLHFTPPLQLVSGFYHLCSPLRLLAIDARRAVVRLMLVLEYAEQPQPGGWSAWLSNTIDAGAGESRYALPTYPFGIVDALALCGTGALLAYLLV